MIQVEMNHDLWYFNGEEPVVGIGNARLLRPFGHALGVVRTVVT